ncbi:hypothetical protein SAMN05421755_10605 [Nitrosomonas sp. Nm33]|nr:hypothetical protein SAMN05421755_10605 [Nitrosomonas sp. Nm33]
MDNGIQSTFANGFQAILSKLPRLSNYLYQEILPLSLSDKLNEDHLYDVVSL